MSKPYKKSSSVIIFRLLVFISLVVSSTIFGTFTYLLLREAEHNNYENQYSSIVDQMESIVEISIHNMQAAAEELAITAGAIYGKASQWPNASIPAFQKINENLRVIAKFDISFMQPLVFPENLTSFEEYAKKTYAEDPLYPNGTGHYPDIGFGVFRYLDAEHTERVLDRTGEVDFSNNTFLTPILNGFPVDHVFVYPYFLFNTRADFDGVFRWNFSTDFDSMLDCIDKMEPMERNSSICSSLSNTVIYPTSSGLQPYSVLNVPIFPFFSPDKVVGFMSVAYAWQTIIHYSLPDYVTGIDIIFCNDYFCFTYTIKDGRPEFRGEGDMHDTKFDDMVRTMGIGLGEFAAPSSEKPVLYFYPSEDFYDIYHTDFPLLCAITAVSLIVFTSLIFLGYDFFVKADVRAVKEILESKKRFVRYISHEIRTPMNTVNIGLRILSENLNNILEQNPASEKQKKGVDIAQLKLLTEEIREGAETAVMVVNDFLQYDNVENSTLTIEVSLMDPLEFLRKSANIFELQSNSSDVSLNFHCLGLYDKEDEESDEPDFKIPVDKIRLAQVVQNLVSNALKFTPPGKEVFVTCSQKVDGLPKYEINNTEYLDYVSAGSFLLVVEDSGPGMSKETVNILFGETVEFDVNELQRGQVSGLGLWISKSIVALHGGLLWVESEGEGKGTKFFLEIPLLKKRLLSQQLKNRQNFYSMPFDKVVPEQVPSESTIVLFPETPKMQLKKILIVDDAPSNRKMLARLLSMRGYECDVVEDGLDCVCIMREEAKLGICTYNCILLDYQMIHLNGPETAERVRKMGFGKNKVKIIGVTGNVMKEDMDYFLAKGADLIMQKPFCLEIFEKEWN